MKTTLVFLIAVALAAALPYEDQMALTNSLIVGRDDQSDLIEWSCKVCDPSNRPSMPTLLRRRQSTSSA